MIDPFQTGGHWGSGRNCARGSGWTLKTMIFPPSFDSSFYCTILLFDDRLRYGVTIFKAK